LNRRTYRRPIPVEDDAPVRQRIRELAQERPRFGSPRLHVMLRREGLVINHKRTERLYREEGRIQAVTATPDFHHKLKSMRCAMPS
ncbi:IS3 family transposase, partial [Herbaspirillum sp. RTI4]|nr:IS3 family transposase [Herbaspirillum sp. RTI4]